MENRGQRTQYLIALCLSVGSVCVGCYASWMAPVIPKFIANKTDFTIATDEIAWMVSLSSPGFMAGCYLSRSFSDKFGRQATAFGSVIPLAVGSIIIVYARVAWLFYIAKFMWGLGTGLFNVVNGSVILWDIRDLKQKEHKTLRVNIQFDYASHVAWSPDSKAFIVHTVRENNVVVYKIEKKKDGTIGSASPVITFDKVHADDVIGFGISSNGKYMMSCSSKTDMVLWDLKGQQLSRIDTYLMSTYAAKISPCGRFVVATGFAPDVKVMEVCFTRNGEFKQVSKAFELSGHSSGIYDVAFDVDTSHVATISKDGTWKLYHTKIDYSHGESPHVLETGTYTQTANTPHIALSPNAEVLAVSVDSSIEFYDTYTGKLYDTVENVYSGLVNYMQFDASGKYIFVCGDKQIRILHNVCGYFTTIQSCTRLLSTKQTSATVERLNKTIQDCKETLASFGK